MRSGKAPIDVSEDASGSRRSPPWHPTKNRPWTPRDLGGSCGMQMESRVFPRDPPIRSHGFPHVSTRHPLGVGRIPLHFPEWESPRKLPTRDTPTGLHGDAPRGSYGITRHPWGRRCYPYNSSTIVERNLCIVPLNPCAL